MMATVIKLLVITSMALIGAGCNPGVYVKQNPGKHNRGIRYYRPKPYLLLTPATVKKVEAASDGSTTTTYSNPSYQYVNIDMKYMPDFAEEYAITVRSGLGINNTQITLENGWNLTQINQELDSQFDENLTAFGEVLSAAAPLAGAGPPAATGTPGDRATVRATNVPLGYYESIVNRGPDGRKRLYGWRYVGFAPFNACPVDAGGAEFACCNDGSLDVYGLTFEVPPGEGQEPVMVFKKLRTLQEEEYMKQGIVVSDHSMPKQDATTQPAGFTASIVESHAPGDTAHRR